LDVIIVSLFLAAQTLITLPDTVRAELDKGCVGWQLSPVLPEIAAEIKTRTPLWPANLLPGDFNADQRTDVAVLVECKGSVELLAFLSSGTAFTKYVLEPAVLFDARQFIHLIRGEYERDAIGVEYEAIGGHAWLFRDGRWQSVRY
jgi:hypothetical protein